MECKAIYFLRTFKHLGFSLRVFFFVVLQNGKVISLFSNNLCWTFSHTCTLWDICISHFNSFEALYILQKFMEINKYFYTHILANFIHCLHTEIQAYKIKNESIFNLFAFVISSLNKIIKINISWIIFNGTLKKPFEIKTNGIKASNTDDYWCTRM